MLRRGYIVVTFCRKEVKRRHFEGKRDSGYFSPPRFFHLAETLKRSQIDQNINEGVDVGDGLAIAEFRAFDAERNGLAVDALRCRALAVDFLIRIALSIQLMTDTDARTERQGGDTAFLAPVFVGDRAGLPADFWKEQRAHVASVLVGKKAVGTFHKGGLQGHG